MRAGGWWIASLLALVFSGGCATHSPVPRAAVIPSARLERPRPRVEIPPPAPRRPVDFPPPRQDVPAPVPGESFDQVLAGQVFLARRHFSCGCVDGVMGEKTRRALRAWQAREGLTASGTFDEETLRRLDNGVPVLKDRAVTSADHEGLMRMPSTWLEKSQQPTLGYETVLERLAEEAQSSQGLLRRLNPDADWPDPPAGAIVRMPDIKGKRPPAASEVRISLAQKTITVLDERGRILALFPCSIARDKAKRPSGVLTVERCAENPVYYFDPAVFPEDPEALQLGRKLAIPPGPNNPVGVAWIGLSLPGYGIHGTPHPEDIGKTESHGCFRLANWNAKKLLNMVRIGMPVQVGE